MGSLVPGWDTENIIPKGLQGDYKDEHGRLLNRSSSHRVSRPSSPRMMRRMSSDVGSHKPTESHHEHLPNVSQGPSSPGSPRSPKWVATEDDKGAKAGAWWSRMDSASFNEPFEEDRDAWAHGTYTPQHDITAHAAAAVEAIQEEVKGQ